MPKQVVYRVGRPCQAEELTRLPFLPYDSPFEFTKVANQDPCRNRKTNCTMLMAGWASRCNPGARDRLRIALVYDLDGCHNPTGVTRHALAQLEQLAGRPEVGLTLIAGRMTQPEALDFWRSMGDLPRRELPLAMRHWLRWWRHAAWPTVEHWSGPVDWVYCPSEYGVVTRKARRAVTSHDVLQNLQGPYGPRMRHRLGRIFDAADLVLSVSDYNTARLLENFPACHDKVALVPNAADDLFFSPAEPRERAAVRRDLGLPEGVPYLISVANFQPRKNLPRLIRAAARLPEVARGDLALVLLGTGSEDQMPLLQASIDAAGSTALIRLPGYRQGPALRASYAEAVALVFPSFCESFGIPAVEAMAQGTPVALADSTALPEIAGTAGWYFDPDSDDCARSPRFARCSTTRRNVSAGSISAGRSPAVIDGRRRPTPWSEPCLPATDPIRHSPCPEPPRRGRARLHKQFLANLVRWAGLIIRNVEIIHFNDNIIFNIN